MKRALVPALAAAWQLSASAAEAIPPHLAGLWGTAESLYAGTAAQSELHLQADGLGVVVFSSAGQTDGKPRAEAPGRVIMGLPLRAAFDGKVLTAQPFIPPGLAGPDDKAPKPEEMKFSCRYGAQDLTLACSGPNHAEMVMKRRSETVPAQTTDLLKQMQAAEAERGK